MLVQAFHATQPSPLALTLAMTSPGLWIPGDSALRRPPASFAHPSRVSLIVILHPALRLQMKDHGLTTSEISLRWQCQAMELMSLKAKTSHPEHLLLRGYIPRLGALPLTRRLLRTPHQLLLAGPAHSALRPLALLLTATSQISGGSVLRSAGPI